MWHAVLHLKRFVLKPHNRETIGLYFQNAVFQTTKKVKVNCKKSQIKNLKEMVIVSENVYDE